MATGSEKKGYFAFILFLIWPFLAAASAISNFRKPWAKNIVWAFVAFYGFTFAIGAESVDSDINSYLNQLQTLHQYDFTISTAVQYYQDSSEIDLVRNTIAILLSRFTDSQSVLTLVYGIIFGFFFSRNLFYVLEKLEGKLSWLTVLLIVCFFFIVPIWQINGFRFWTAAHVFLYGLLPYLFEGKKSGLLISITSVLFHFAYLLPVLLLLVVALAGNWLTFYFLFFVTTFFVAEIDLAVINNVIENYTPEAFQDRTVYYRSEDDMGVETVVGEEGSRRWYAVWYTRALNYSVVTLLIGMYITGKNYFREKQEWMNLFCYVLLFFGVANMLGSISSSGRFVMLAIFFALPLIILYLQNVTQEKVMKRFTLVVTPAFLLFIIVSLRIGLYSMSATSILGNPIVAAFFLNNNISMNDFLRSLL